MALSTSKEDLRIKKTYKSLINAMYTLLKHRNFIQITVNDLCHEALISRATFYTHFLDKYDLLEYWMADILKNNVTEMNTYDQLENNINQFVYKNETIIKNIVSNANNETLEVLYRQILAVLNITDEKNRKQNPEYLVLSNFASGGMIYYLLWHVKNNFPKNLPLMNRYVYDIISRLMGHRSSQIEELKSLKNGRGIQYLLNEASKILGNPVEIHDANYNLIARSDAIVTDFPLWNDLLTNGRFDDKTIDFFRAESFIDKVANSDVISYLHSDKLKYDMINGKILDKENVRLVNLLVVAYNKPFEVYDPILVEEICMILSEEIRESEYYENLNRIYQQTLIRDLINGKIKDKQLVTAKLADIYKNLKTNIYLAVAEIPHFDHAYIRDLFWQTQKEFKYYIYDKYLIIIVSTDKETLNVEIEFSKLFEILSEHNIYVGISSCFDNLFELHKYFKEAVDALKNQRIFLYNKEK